MHLVILLYALFALVFTVSKTGLEFASPLFFVGSRMLLAGALLLVYLFITDKKALKIGKREWMTLFQLGFFNIYLTNALEFLGLQHLTSFKTCFIYSLSPFASALLSYLFLSEKISVMKWIGLLVGCVGMIPILLTQSMGEEKISNFFFISWAELAVIGAAFSSVYGWIILKKLVINDRVSPLASNGYGMVIGGGIALIHSLLTENWDPVPVQEAFPFAQCALFLVIVSNLICYNLYGHLLKRFTATFISFAGFSTPFFTALFGWLFLSETVGAAFFLSSIGVFCGLILFYQEELKLGYYQPSCDQSLISDT